ncbi:MAG: DUF1599 domain-containing protein [Flavobacteriales bacterium]|nr:DUF1599 domain-containing protein [Flavobacteriales bacterium]
MEDKTEKQYREVVKRCRELFEKKTKDYGTAWRILRPASLTDQIFIKASRIRSIEEKGQQKVDEGVEAEYVGIYNYCIITLMQLELPLDAPAELDPADVMLHYDRHSDAVYDLMRAKNHDYGEAWRLMRIPTFTDLILMKLARIRQIEDNAGQTLVSEGLEANYSDIMNYAIFALIRLGEANS